MIEEIKVLILNNTSLEKLDRSKPLDTSLEKAEYYCKKLIPAMKEVRKSADELEKIVSDELWPLPKYREILFIS